MYVQRLYPSYPEIRVKFFNVELCEEKNLNAVLMADTLDSNVLGCVLLQTALNRITFKLKKGDRES